MWRWYVYDNSVHLNIGPMSSGCAEPDDMTNTGQYDLCTLSMITNVTFQEKKSRTAHIYTHIYSETCL